jgi:hypothetical protein
MDCLLSYLDGRWRGRQLKEGSMDPQQQQGRNDC